MTSHAFEQGRYAVVIGWDQTARRHVVDVYERLERDRGPAFGRVVSAHARTLSEVADIVQRHRLAVPALILMQLAEEQVVRRSERQGPGLMRLRQWLGRSHDRGMDL